jgi:hypothetical protein
MALALATFCLPIAGTASASDTSAHPRPMKATTTSEIQFVGSCGEGGAAAVLAGTGSMTHLGRVTFAGSECTYNTAPDTGFGRDGRMTFVAANGDMLYGTYDATFGPASADMSLPVTIHMTFGGGTGRFVDATGQMTGTGVVTMTGPATVENVATWSGWVAY